MTARMEFNFGQKTKRTLKIITMAEYQYSTLLARNGLRIIFQRLVSLIPRTSFLLSPVGVCLVFIHNERNAVFGILAGSGQTQLGDALDLSSSWTRCWVSSSLSLWWVCPGFLEKERRWNLKLVLKNLDLGLSSWLLVNFVIVFCPLCKDVMALTTWLLHSTHMHTHVRTCTDVCAHTGPVILLLYNTAFLFNPETGFLY